MIVAGFGFRDGAAADSLAAALDDALAAAGLDTPPDLLATLPAKAAHPAFLALAERLGLATRAAAPDGRPLITRSPAVLARHGTGSVAEAAALAAAGPGGRLAGPRTISFDRMATCAIALGETQ